MMEMLNIFSQYVTQDKLSFMIFSVAYWYRKQIDYREYEYTVLSLI